MQSTTALNQRSVLWLLSLGFALVIALLIGASLAAVRSARSIRQSAASLAREQVLATRLISELQLEQAALNALSHQFTRSHEAIDRTKLLGTLRQIEELLARLLRETPPAADAVLWIELQAAAHEFSSNAQRILDTDDSSPAALEELFQAHSKVLEGVAQLMAASARRTVDAETRIAEYLGKGLKESLWLLGLALVLSIVCAAVTARAVAQFIFRMRLQESELSRVSWRMLETQENALRRFSHELHDDLGQSLAAVRAIVENLDQATLEAKREECLSVVDDSITNVRELSQLLRPVILDDFGLDASLRWLGERFSERTRIAWRYESNFEGRLPDEVETHLFRITQEALTNVARHSQADAVEVELRRDKDHIRLRISDNGRGLRAASEETRPTDPEAPQRHGLGLVGMRVRADWIGGELRLSAPLSGGVTIQVTVPVVHRDDGRVP